MKICTDGGIQTSKRFDFNERHVRFVLVLKGSNGTGVKARTFGGAQAAGQRITDKGPGGVMGEIKSTMDIIMEKTKGMTLTEEEKRDIQRKEVTGTVLGLLQKLEDGAMDVSHLRREIDALGGKRHLAEEILHKEVASRLDPLSDNPQLLEVVQEVLKADPSPFSQAISGIREMLASEASQREMFLRGEFEKRGVSGEAVTPNLYADPQWNESLTEKKEQLRERLLSIRF
jgi:hypothetical protein